MDLAKVRKKLKERQQGKNAKGLSDATGAVPERDMLAARDASGAAEGYTSLEDVRDGGETFEAEEGTEGSHADDGSNVGEFFVFAIADEYYAFRLFDLHEVLRKQMITHVPRMPDYMVGITSLRGKIIPIMDLRKRLSMHADREDRQDMQMLIIRGPKGPIGVLIDRVIGVRRIDETLVSGPPPHLDEQQLPLVGAVVRDQDRFISILDVDHVFDFRPLSLLRRT